MNPKVDFYFTRSKWQAELALLRDVVLGCGLEEELKWGCPCYTKGGRNIVLLHVFKDYCAMLFFKGALLKDEHGILIRQTENVQAARQVRFISVDQVLKLVRTLRTYIKEAIKVEESGLKVAVKKTSQYKIPPEFADRLAEDARLSKAFKKLTPGRQRGYILYFSAAKQSQTRQARVQKYLNHILKGKGLND